MRTSILMGLFCIAFAINEKPFDDFEIVLGVLVSISMFMDVGEFLHKVFKK